MGNKKSVIDYKAGIEQMLPKITSERSLFCLWQYVLHHYCIYLREKFGDERTTDYSLSSGENQKGGLIL